MFIKNQDLGGDDDENDDAEVVNEEIRIDKEIDEVEV